MSIDQVLTPPPETIPDKDDQTPEEFDISAGQYVEWQTNRHYPQLVTWTSQLNSTAITITADRIAATQSVIDAAAQAVLAESAAKLAVIASTATVYDAETEYNAGDIVYDPAHRYYAYTSIEDNNAGHTPSTNPAWWTRSIPDATKIEYENRDSLRSMIPSNDDKAIIDGLGLFIFESDSEEPDDDETCFATANGRWLLEAVHWDLVDAWQKPDDEVRDEWDEDEAERLDAHWDSRVLYGTATCAITSLAATTSTSFTGTVAGAVVGDRVFVHPPAALGNTSTDTSRLSCYAYISTVDTVTIMICNSSASSAAINAAAQTTWPITIFRQ